MKMLNCWQKPALKAILEFSLKTASKVWKIQREIKQSKITETFHVKRKISRKFNTVLKSGWKSQGIRNLVYGFCYR